MSGVEILAHIAETHTRNVAPTTRRVLWVIILTGAFLIAIAFASMPTLKATAAAVAGVGVGALLVWFYTSSIGDMLLLVAVLVAILFQQIYSKTKEMIKQTGATESELVSR